MWTETDQAPVPHWNVLVCVCGRASLGQPSPLPQKRLCPKPGGALHTDTPTFFPHPCKLQPPAHCSGWGGQHLQADCSIERPIEGPWPALDPGLALLEHRVFGPWDSEGQGRLWVGRVFALCISCLEIIGQRKTGKIARVCRAQDGTPLPRSLTGALCTLEPS